MSKVKTKEYLVSFQFSDDKVSRFGDFVFSTNEKINVETIRGSIKAKLKEKYGNEKNHIIILSIVCLTDL